MQIVLENIIFVIYTDPWVMADIPSVGVIIFVYKTPNANRIPLLLPKRCFHHVKLQFQNDIFQVERCKKIIGSRIRF